MTGDRSLRDKLARLAARGADPLDYRLPASDAGTLIAAVLEEVDAAVLGRTLDIRTDDGAVLGLDIAGRRLLRVRSVPPGADGAAGLAGRPLSPEDIAALAALHATLLGLLRGGGALRLTLGRLAGPAGGAEIGCPAAALAAAWDQPAPAASGGGGIAGFVEACASQALAWIARDGDGAGARFGPEAECARLEALSQTGAPLAGPPGPACMIVGLPGDDRVLFRGWADAGEVLLIHPAAEAQALRMRWRAAVQGSEGQGAGGGQGA